MSDITRRTLFERYERLIEISLDLASTLDLDDLLNRIVRAAADLSNAEEASILLYDEAKEQLFFQAATNDPVMRGLSVPVGSSIAGWIITNREPIIIGDVMKDERYFKSIAQTTQTHTSSLLGVPMIEKDKVIGVLEAINKIQGHFNDEDQEILMALGAQAAVAIENAKLFLQSDLIAEFVHEIRTPLSSINTAAQLLLYPQLPAEKHKQMVSVIQSETSRLSEMATSFLDLAKLESGRSPFQVREFQPCDLLEDCANLMQENAVEKGLKFKKKYPETLPVIEADYDKMKQALLNLLSNAIKYNRPDGKITLKAYSENNEVIIEVADTGIGIPREHMEHLFEKFYRVPGSENVSSGTGLGLSVVKRIVEGHQGKIQVDSQAGKGTTFVIHLPIQ